MARLTDKAAAGAHYFATAMRRVEGALHGHLAQSDLIPKAWHEIAHRRAPPARVRVTLRVDADVLAFFRSMGTGHLGRMNDVLAAFVHARVAGVVKGAEMAGGSLLAAQEAAEAEAARTAAILARRVAHAEAAERLEAVRAERDEAERRAKRLAEVRARKKGESG